MQYEEFVREVDAAVRATATVDTFAKPQANLARWETRARNAAVALVEPRNVSVTLAGSSEPPGTTWYPIDAALVPVVSRRIAAYLGEA
jgi:hypothetical protein